MDYDQSSSANRNSRCTDILELRGEYIKGQENEDIRQVWKFCLFLCSFVLCVFRISVLFFVL
jgi:hypothetical protein